MRSTPLTVAFTTCLLLSACGDNDPEPPLETTLGGLSVRVESSPARVDIRSADGEPIINGLPGGPAGETWPPPQVAAAVRYVRTSWEFEVGSFKVEELGGEPWLGATRFVNLRLEDAAVHFDLRGDDGDLGSAIIAEAGDSELSITITAPEDKTRVSFGFACAPDEHFLGFGGQTSAVDHRGDRVPLWVSEDGITKASTDFYEEGIWFLQGRLHSTHTPMPIYLSSRGYAMLLDTPYRSIFSMCSEQEDAVRIEAWENEMRLRLFYGPTAAEALRRLTDHVGRPQLPPPFTFAPWHDAIYGSENVRRVANALRSEDVPSSLIWTEDWRGGNHEGTGYVLEEDWEVDRELYPDFETLADELHGLGYKFLTYNNTFLDSRVPAHEEAVAGGHTIKDQEGGVYLFTGVKFEPTTLLDLSSPDAVAWGKQKYRAGLELGADGWMADFAEWLPHDAVLASGDDALARHNHYPVDFARMNRELFDEMYAEDGVERLFFMRSAYLGSQPLVSVIWAGDQQTDWTADDGLASVIPMGIGLGVTGFPYFGHDIAGYMSQLTEPTTKELWFRWLTFGALSPVMRTHHGRDAEANWNWESDAETIAHMKRWAKFHIQLFPYLYAMADHAAETGMPMFRPLALDYPEFEPGWSARDQYMLGDRLFVAPVMQPGATQRTVALPEGSYYALTDDQKFDVPAGGGEVTVDVPLEEIAVFAPAGAVLVLLPESVDTLTDADAGSGIVTLADAGDDREIWVWPGGQSAFTEVAGLSYDWNGSGLSGEVTTATFAGADVPIVTDASGTWVEVTGPGTLQVNGTATLVIDGGEATRSIRVRFRG